MVRPPYEAAVRLSALAAGNWARIDGHYSGQGTDLLDLPFSRFLSVIYVWALEHMTSEDGEKFERTLEDPLPGLAASRERRIDPQAELDQLKNL